MKAWLKQNRLKCLLAFFFIAVVPLIIEYFICNGIFGYKPFTTAFTAEIWLSFWGSYLGAIGTVLLGGLALYQNKKINRVNEKLAKEQIISSSKSVISAVDISMPFTDFNILINNGKGYCPCLFEQNLDIENNFYYSGINFKFRLHSDEFNYITLAKITSITIYYNFVNIEGVGTDENPGYFYSDSDEGGYCKELSFEKSKGYYSVNCLENGLGEINCYCLLDKTDSTDDLKKNIGAVKGASLNKSIPNTMKSRNSLMKSERIIVEIQGEYINGLKVVTKGGFQFKLEWKENQLVVTNKIFIPGGYDYKEETPNE